jgi:hypothetical protein
VIEGPANGSAGKREPGLLRRLRRAADASNLLPEALQRTLGPEGTVRPKLRKTQPAEEPPRGK